MNVEELIALLTNPPEDGPPATIYDDLLAAYSAETAGWAGERDSASARIQELEGEISRLKAHNYDLLTTSAAGAPDQQEADELDGNDNDNEGSDDLTFDALFQPKSED